MARHACIRQHDQFDCGAAALATVARQHGLAIGIGRIRELVGTDRAGTTLLGLLKGAEAIGFSAKGAKGDWDGLRQVPLPAICHVVNEQRLGHFVVVHRIRGDRLVVADPAVGLVEPARDEFCRGWTGYALLLTPRDLRPRPEGADRWAFIRALLAPHRGILAGALLCSLVLTVLGLSTSFFIQHLVDHILVHQRAQVLNWALAGMAAVLVFRALFDFVRSWFLVDAARKVDLCLIACYLRHVMGMPMRFFETRRVGEILSRVNDAVKIRQLVSTTALTTLVDGLTIVVAAAVMLITDWRLGAACLVFAPLVLAVGAGLRRPLARRQRDLMERAADLEARFVEDVGGVETIKSYGAEAGRLEAAERKLVGIARTLLGTSLFGMTLQGATALIVGAATVAVLGYGGHRVMAGELTVGELMFFYSLCGYLYGPLERLSGALVSVQDAAIALDRLWQVLSLGLEADGGTGDSKPPAGAPRREIRFEGVSFAYGHREPVLDRVDLVVPAGKVVALVGESGCGKSTLCKLVARHHDPTAGRILVDGIDLRDLALAAWRRRVGYVAQDAQVFSGTIAENIAFGRPRAPLSRIARAARIAGIDGFVESLPERWKTVVGERGANLSGGQRQRLAIARAILANPRVFVLDEATSALDTRTEQAIQRTLAAAVRGRTAIVVAHRLSTIRHADLICVMDHGRIVERGAHDELMALDGRYRALWRAQAGEDGGGDAAGPADDDLCVLLDDDESDDDAAGVRVATAAASDPRLSGVAGGGARGEPPCT